MEQTLSDIQMTPVSTIDVDAIADKEAMMARFSESFNRFLKTKKLEAAVEAVREELGDAALENVDFVQQVASRIDDEALTEKRFVFISVSQQYLQTLEISQTVELV